jgi:hypothetical protein
MSEVVKLWLLIDVVEIMSTEHLLIKDLFDQFVISICGVRTLPVGFLCETEIFTVNDDRERSYRARGGYKYVPGSYAIVPSPHTGCNMA